MNEIKVGDYVRIAFNEVIFNKYKQRKPDLHWSFGICEEELERDMGKEFQVVLKSNSTVYDLTFILKGNIWTWPIWLLEKENPEIKWEV